jgi:DNA-binding MarR family transcriptional regulator
MNQSAQELPRTAFNPRGLKAPFIGPRQRAALRYLAGRKTSPTRSEIGRHLGITKVSAHLLVDKLIDGQLVARIPGGWRNLYVTKTGYGVLGRDAMEVAP